MQLRKPWRPPGLAELAKAENLTEQQIEQLTDMYGTIRGKRPTTVEEWRPLYEAVKTYLKGNADA